MNVFFVTFVREENNVNFVIKVGFTFWMSWPAPKVDNSYRAKLQKSWSLNSISVNNKSSYIVICLLLRKLLRSLDVLSLSGPESYRCSNNRSCLFT